MADRLSLNGGRTRPLSQASKNVLQLIAGAPQPRSAINPGVADRLEREDLVDTVFLASPYATRKGRVAHLRITDKGRAVLTGTETHGEVRT